MQLLICLVILKLTLSSDWTEPTLTEKVVQVDSDACTDKDIAGAHALEFEKSASGKTPMISATKNYSFVNHYCSFIYIHT